MALRRLQSLHKPIVGNPNIFAKYNKTIHMYIEEGSIRKMTKEETKKNIRQNRVFSTHPVFHQLMLDMTVKYKNKSLKIPSDWKHLLFVGADSIFEDTTTVDTY